MIPLCCILVLLLVGFAYQTRRHEKLLATIPIRVHVNGSRGKSSVTRLIAAGLRAGGIRTVAKTTGTAPSLILPDGSEVPVVRAGSPNIIEQVGIVRRAARLNAQALVAECMAIKPELQQVLEDRMIRSTHSVITNVRPDHLDEMGPRMSDVAQSLAHTIPRSGKFFTAEPDFHDILHGTAQKRRSSFQYVAPAPRDEEALRRFCYFEHGENLALALAVCAELGVDREVALDGMVASTPDPGAMRIYRLGRKEREIQFINGFAVNDPDSYLLAWQRLTPFLPFPRRVLGLVVCRKDRIERSLQLGQLLGSGLPVDVCLVAGKETAPFRRAFGRVRQTGRSPLDMEGAGAAEVFAAIEGHSGEVPLVVFGMGNIVGLGSEIVEEFRGRSLAPDTLSDGKTEAGRLSAAGGAHHV